MPNRLEHEDSPYLRRHADNPVDWYPWCEEPFAKARREHKPIFLSIGYSTCHWCHVMERESFRDPEIAKILNAHFVSVKVDREERPDIDKHFQAVYRKMNGRPGGWPTSIFLTEEGKPFYAATYLPPEPRYGLTSFSELLTTVRDRYAQAKARLEQEADDVLAHLNPVKDKIEATKLDTSIVSRTLTHAKTLFDFRFGGFSKAPKFPQTSLLDLLMDVAQLQQNDEAMRLVRIQLDHMAKGGLRDIVEGGFCRYSTDDRWLVPHFEKMTYDNALLSQLYLRAYHLTSHDFYKTIAFETLDFLLRERSDGTLFYAASDADTDGKEGAYFAYDHDEACEAFRAAGIPESSANDLCKALHITPEGNFEGASIVRLDHPEKSEDIPYFDTAIDALRRLRETRTKPFVDTKFITSWNAMVVTALFKAGRSHRPYLEKAIATLEALTEKLYPDNRLYHSVLPNATPRIEGFLEDYAYLGEALIEAYRSTLDERYLIKAQTLANQAIERFYRNGFWKFSIGEFETDAERYDTSYPSSLAVIVDFLQSIASLVDPVYKKFVFRSLEICSYDVMRQPLSTPALAKAVIRYLYDDILIKGKEETLTPYISNTDRLGYPYLFLRTSDNDGFMLCNTSSCFGESESFLQTTTLLHTRIGADQ